MIMLKIITSIMLFVLITCLAYEFTRSTNKKTIEYYVYLYVIATLGLAEFCIWI